MAITWPRKRFTVEEYHRMSDAGILTEDSRVELIEGEIVEMAPINMPHALYVARLSTFFFRNLDPQVLVWAQNPIRLGDDTEVQPDVALLRPRTYSPNEPAPGPKDVLLAIEVSDSTLTWDRKVKVPLYARAGIPEVWLVGVRRGVVEVYSEPEGGTYRQVRRISRGEAVAVPGFDGVAVSLDEVLGA